MVKDAGNRPRFETIYATTPDLGLIFNLPSWDMLKFGYESKLIGFGFGFAEHNQTYLTSKR